VKLRPGGKKENSKYKGGMLFGHVLRSRGWETSRNKNRILDLEITRNSSQKKKKNAKGFEKSDRASVRAPHPSR